MLRFTVRWPVAGSAKPALADLTRSDWATDPSLFHTALKLQGSLSKMNLEDSDTRESKTN